VERLSLAALEYPAIIERVAALAATAYGAALVRSLLPSADADEVARRQALTSEAVLLLDAAAEPSLHGVADVRDCAERARRGAALQLPELSEVATSIGKALEARDALQASRELAPLLHDLVEPIDPALAEVRRTILARVEEDGSALRDDASPQLRRLRRELRSGKQRVGEELARLARSRELRDLLQETFVTERGGRPVLAVKASARSQVGGIVHDASSSGQTLFVEPFAVVEDNNRLAETAGAEREEVERILRELSDLVGARAAALRALVEVTGRLDLALACGVLSRRWRGAPVQVGDEVRLLGACHPLLDEETAVPIDLDLGKLRALVVSGPNTGGKTVALKTLGLAALLHQAGLRPPAEAAVLPIFDRVLADIGDQQSIEMSLSTFSGHLDTILRILAAATHRSLVLLDELAAGTDPVEGSALAQALLGQLSRQARVTVVTTHYPEVKEWAGTTDGVANAATGFDPETGAPLYRPALGRPGTSHALRIAERLGLDPAIVADARSRVSPERLRTAELLAAAEQAEQQAADLRAAAERERVEAALLRDQTQARLAALDAAIERVRESAARERQAAIDRADRELLEARGELQALREEIRAARRREQERRRSIEPGERAAERERDRRLGAASERSARAARALRRLHEPLPLLAPLAEGDPVEADELGVRGTVVAVEGEYAEVAGAGGLRVRVPLARLRPAAQAAAASDSPQPSVRILAAARGDVPDELDVRGLRAQEAREAVSSFIDEAALAGLPTVRVVHGRGTGALRAAVRSELRAHTLVRSHESDSADGATVVDLHD
jgi:DNA mismatch repair protein MutS2